MLLLASTGQKGGRNLVKRFSVWAVMLLALFVLSALQAGAVGGSSLASGRYSTLASVSSPGRQTGGVKFLTLPFTDPRITVSQGWLYDWGSVHGGIDYMLGDRHSTNWQPFDVVAAADGWACGNCTSRQGNAVWIKHEVEGHNYFTYYGHLATIDPSIPQGGQGDTVWVRRGQKIGVSGKTGADVVHLHFQVNNGPDMVDPYDLWTTYQTYAPGCWSCSMGNANLWTTNPPSLPSAGPPPPPPPPPPANTPVLPTSTRIPPTYTPIPTPTKISCALGLGQIVKGTISDKAPETRYCLSASAGDWVSIRMFAANGSSLDTYLKLYAPDGKLMAVDDDGAQVDFNSFLVKQLPQAGMYSVVATR